MNNERASITAIMIGHYNSGKSTTSGHLLYKCGEIAKSTLETIEISAREEGKSSFKYAWVVDRLKLERERCMTINISYNKLETENFLISLINAPGHRDFLKNMLTGTSEADVAVLIVSSTIGEFEAGICEYGQTREHILLAYTLGVKQVIVCVNKMDEKSCNWSQLRFLEIKQEISEFLQKVGFNPNKVQFIPISGWLGDNLIEFSLNLKWYRGPTLLEALNQVQVPKRSIEKSLRIPVQNSYRIAGVGTVIVGKVQSGVITQDMSIMFAPPHIIANVRSIAINYNNVSEAKPGDFIGFHVRGVHYREITRGCVASDYKDNPALACNDFIAQVIILNHPNTIKTGYTPMIDCHTGHFPCKIEKLISKIDRRTGRVTENEPKSLKNSEAATVLFKPIKRMCVESFVDYPQLGRIVIRDFRQTVGVGVIKKVNKKTFK